MHGCSECTSGRVMKENDEGAMARRNRAGRGRAPLAHLQQRSTAQKSMVERQDAMQLAGSNSEHGGVQACSAARSRGPGTAQSCGFGCKLSFGPLSNVVSRMGRVVNTDIAQQNIIRPIASRKPTPQLTQPRPTSGHRHAPPRPARGTARASTTSTLRSWVRLIVSTPIDTLR